MLFHPGTEIEDVVLLYDERGETAKDAESINVAEYLPVSSGTQAAITDQDMKLLMKTLKDGCMAAHSHCCSCGNQFRDDLPYRMV